MPGLRLVAPGVGAVRRLPDLPRVPVPLQHHGTTAGGSPGGRRDLQGKVPQRRFAGPLVVQRQDRLPQAHLQRPATHRPHGGCHRRSVPHRWHERRPGLPGLQLPGREHGLRRRGKGRPGLRARREEGPAAGGCGHKRRREAPGGSLLADADGQDGQRGQPTSPGGAALHRRVRQPDYRAGVRQLRKFGRRAAG